MKVRLCSILLGLAALCMGASDAQAVCWGEGNPPYPENAGGYVTSQYGWGCDQGNAIQYIDVYIQRQEAGVWQTKTHQRYQCNSGCGNVSTFPQTGPSFFCTAGGAWNWRLRVNPYWCSACAGGVRTDTSYSGLRQFACF